jgi:hypothetical protein
VIIRKPVCEQINTEYFKDNLRDKNDCVRDKNDCVRGKNG